MASTTCTGSRSADRRGFIIGTVELLLALSALLVSMASATSGTAAGRAQQTTGPSLTLGASTVEAGGTLIATGDCAGITNDVVPSVHVVRVNGQVPPSIYDAVIEGIIRPDGTFEVTLTIPASVAPGQFAAWAFCVFDGDQLLSGDEVFFEVTPGPDTATSSTAPLVVTTRPSPLVPTTTRTPPQPRPASPVGASPSYTG